MNHPLSEQELLRREKRNTLQSSGVDPYPAASFPVDTSAAAIHKGYPQQPADFQSVTLAGRIMARRIMGAAAFATLQDESGKIQLYLHRDTICPEEDKAHYNTVFKKLMDIGDIVGITGHVFTTKLGEVSVHVEQLTLLSKSLKPLPVVKEETDEQGNIVRHDAFTDPEQRYRQRYVDLVVNPEVRDVFQQRARIIKEMRRYLEDELGCLEVETPVLQPLYGGAAARPFTTHHNALDMPLYLRISDELYLKRLIVGGYPGVYEFAKDFRNEGMSRFHNPEFTLMEAYVAYKDYYWAMDRVEEMLERLALSLHGTTQVTVGEHIIDFKRPWKRYTMFEAIAHFTGIDISEMDETALHATAKKLQVPLPEGAGSGKIIDEIFGEKCEPNLLQPTFITDYPVEMSPLAKRHRDNPKLVERFEAICNGKEICNTFSELNDPIDQRKRFEAQAQLAQKGDDEAMVLDEDFLRAMSYGMPPTVGIGIGIDRLVMILTNQPSIQDVIFFPQMKPEKHLAQEAEPAVTA